MSTTAKSEGCSHRSSFDLDQFQSVGRVCKLGMDVKVESSNSAFVTLSRVCFSNDQYRLRRQQIDSN